MKLEVGMFYRYKGQIGKYKKITELDRYPSFTNNYLRVADNILLNNAKFSYNIIDLIEAGDYINGHKVMFVNDNVTYPTVSVETSGGAIYEIITQKNIKSIVTKEQMEQMLYKI